MRRGLASWIIFASACGSSTVEDFDGGATTRPDATTTAKPDASATLDDASAPEDDATATIADDAGPPSDALPAVPPFPVRVAYAATAADPTLLELFLTDTSTSRARVHGALAGGPTEPTKGPLTGGLQEFRWSRDGQRLLYLAQQDTFELTELYVADVPGRRPAARRKLSNPSTVDAAGAFEESRVSARVAFQQTIAGAMTSMFVVSSSAATPIPRRLSQGLPSPPVWSPVADQLVWHDIIVSRNDRDLWFADTRRGTRERVNPGANLGFGGAMDWAPDGASFVYSADERADRLFELFGVPITSGVLGARTRLHPAFPAGAQVAGFTDVRVLYSPDGTRVAYAADPITRRLDELFVIDLTAMGPTVPRVVSNANATGDGVTRFAFNGDGSWLVYASNVTGSGQYDLFLADPSGVIPAATISPVQSVRREAWAHGDDTIVMEIDERDVHRLYAARITATGPDGAAVLISNPDEHVESWDLSRDGNHLIYSVEAAAGRYELHAVDLGTLASRRLTSGSMRAVWCWASKQTRALAIVTDLEVSGTAELYWVADVVAPTFAKISGPLVEDGDVLSCAFPPDL